MTGKAACWREKNPGGSWVRFVFAVKQTSKCCPCCCPYTAHSSSSPWKGAWQGKKKTRGGKIVEKFYGQQQQKLQYSQGERGLCSWWLWKRGCASDGMRKAAVRKSWKGKNGWNTNLKRKLVYIYIYENIPIFHSLAKLLILHITKLFLVTLKFWISNIIYILTDWNQHL